jgi:hypothetical protein
MMDMHKESKGKNFNPYIFKAKGRSPAVTGDESFRIRLLLIASFCTDPFLTRLSMENSLCNPHV